jgi:hypothetical protein
MPQITTQRYISGVSSLGIDGTNQPLMRHRNNVTNRSRVSDLMRDRNLQQNEILLLNKRRHYSRERRNGHQGTRNGRMTARRWKWRLMLSCQSRSGDEPFSGWAQTVDCILCISYLKANQAILYCLHLQPPSTPQTDILALRHPNSTSRL